MREELFKTIIIENGPADQDAHFKILSEKELVFLHMIMAAAGASCGLVLDSLIAAEKSVVFRFSEILNVDLPFPVIAMCLILIGAGSGIFHPSLNRIRAFAIGFAIIVTISLLIP